MFEEEEGSIRHSAVPIWVDNLSGYGTLSLQAGGKKNNLKKQKQLSTGSSLGALCSVLGLRCEGLRKDPFHYTCVYNENTT